MKIENESQMKIQMADARDEISEGYSIDPFTIVIFGASGDLSFRKLFPSLYDLYSSGFFTQPFRIVGAGRVDLNDESFRKQLREAMEENGSIDQSSWKDFSEKIHFQNAHFNKDDFDKLAARLRDIDEKAGTGGNRIFYFALPPSVFGPAAEHIAEAGFAEEHTNGNGWTRLVIEKPVGSNLESAKELNARLLSHFKESQLFRIDHYLAKEMVQNVLTFRLANAIFEPIWNRRYIDHVRITAAETLGVEDRAGYYEKAGVLRDMMQNHLMQVLALTAMEPSARWEVEDVRDEKVKLFRSLRPFTGNAARSDDIVLGQYTEGEINGNKVPAYREEKNVDKDSITPTYARLRVMVDNWRWQGVPFYLTSGKRLPRKTTEVVIQFKAVPHSTFRKHLDDEISANKLTIEFQPQEKMALSFMTKMPGPRVRLRPAELEFDYSRHNNNQSLSAYARALLDCMVGNQMLFWRQDAVEESWRFIDPVLKHCEDCDPDEQLQFYPAGSWGPEKALNMIPGVYE